MKKSYMPRLVPKISTSSKIFIDKKTKMKHRRNLKGMCDNAV
jgi:hypothetical protein